MKKITTNGEAIEFRIDGSTLLKITKEGCLATPEQAAIVADRLGGNVTIVDTTFEEVAAEIVEEVTVPEEQAPVAEDDTEFATEFVAEFVAEIVEEEVEEEVSATAPKKGKGSKK